MQVKITKEFEYIFKAILDRFEWEKKNTELHGEDFRPTALVGVLADILKTETEFRMGYVDLKELKCLGWVLDWDKYPFTQALWAKIVDAASKGNLKESAKKLKEDSTKIYQLCTSIERSVIRASQRGEFGDYNYKSIECNYPFGQDYVIFTYETQGMPGNEAATIVAPYLKGWLNAVRSAGAAGIKLRVFSRDSRKDVTEIEISDDFAYNEDPTFVLDNCAEYVKKIAQTEGGEVTSNEEDGKLIYNYLNNDLDLSMDFFLEGNAVKAMVGNSIELDWAESTWAAESFESFVDKFNNTITERKM